MKVLITGGAGFIGSHVTESLLKREDHVVSLDNMNDYYSHKIKEKNIQGFKDNPNFKFFKADITNYNEIRKVFEKEKFDKVVHLAACAGVRQSLVYPQIYSNTNIIGTLNLLELSKEFEVKNFIFASSSSVYGNNNKVPFSEGDIVDSPISVYAATKKSGELLCHVYSSLYKMNITCLRFFTVYGPRGRPDMAPLKFTTLIDKGLQIEVYGDGTSSRDYTYISDIVQGIIAALDKNLRFEIINLGNSNTVKLSYFISLIEKNLNKKAKIIRKDKQQGDVEHTYADISKAKRLLQYSPRVKIEEGIKSLVDWYKNEY